MSETPRELLVWEEFVASDGYVFGSGVRSATDDEVRAAVVPLLDLEAAVKAWHDHSVPELYMDVSSWSDCDDLYRDQVRAHVRIAVYAALGLGEES